MDDIYLYTKNITDQGHKRYFNYLGLREYKQHQNK